MGCLLKGEWRHLSGLVGWVFSAQVLIPVLGLSTLWGSLLRWEPASSFSACHSLCLLGVCSVKYLKTLKKSGWGGEWLWLKKVVGGGNGLGEWLWSALWFKVTNSSVTDWGGKCRAWLGTYSRQLGKIVMVMKKEKLTRFERNLILAGFGGLVPYEWGIIVRFHGLSKWFLMLRWGEWRSNWIT